MGETPQSRWGLRPQTPAPPDASGAAGARRTRPVYARGVLLEPIQVSPDGLRADVRVDAPVRAAFEYVSDLHNMVSWWPEHPVYRRLLGDGGAGAVYAWVYVVQRFPIPGL